MVCLTAAVGTPRAIQPEATAAAPAGNPSGVVRDYREGFFAHQNPTALASVVHPSATRQKPKPFEEEQRDRQANAVDIPTSIQLEL